MISITDRGEIYRHIMSAKDPHKQIEIEADLYGTTKDTIGKIWQEEASKRSRVNLEATKKKPGRPKASITAKSEKKAKEVKPEKPTLPPIPKIVFDKIEDDLKAVNIYIKELETILQEKKEAAEDLKSFLDAYKPE